MSFFSTGRQI